MAIAAALAIAKNLLVRFLLGFKAQTLDQSHDSRSGMVGTNTCPPYPAGFYLAVVFTTLVDRDGG